MSSPPNPSLHIPEIQDIQYLTSHLPSPSPIFSLLAGLKYSESPSLCPQILHEITNFNILLTLPETLEKHDLAIFAHVLRHNLGLNLPMLLRAFLTLEDGSRKKMEAENSLKYMAFLSSQFDFLELLPAKDRQELIYKFEKVAREHVQGGLTLDTLGSTEPVSLGTDPISLIISKEHDTDMPIDENKLKLVKDTPADENSATVSRTCKLCGNSNTEKLYFYTSCTHSFHKSCFEDHILEKANQMKMAYFCPVKKCKYQLSKVKLRVSSISLKL